MPNEYPTCNSGADAAEVLDQLKPLWHAVVAAEETPRLEQVHPQYAQSARNLLHYLALRRQDLRPLQMRLAALGLSSLGRAESHVLAALEATLKALHRLARRPLELSGAQSPLDWVEGQQLLHGHTDALLGPPAYRRGVRIMVTMPSEAAERFALVDELVRQGMDCMRINCAHDDAAAWKRMIDHMRQAADDHGRSCRVVMDLGGPKLRTGPIQSGPAVLRLRPRRDRLGAVRQAARVWLVPEGTACTWAPGEPYMPVTGEWLRRLQEGERLRLQDARGAKRALKVVEITAGGALAETKKTTYIVAGTRLVPEGDLEPVTVGDLPAAEGEIWLRPGDPLLLCRGRSMGEAAVVDERGHSLRPARIACTLPQALERINAGEAVFFDDGKIGAVVEEALPDGFLLRIRQARPGGSSLRADKGINLPDSNLGLGALTAKDIKDLAFVAAHADVVELSFVNSAADVEALQERLLALGTRRPAIVVKIETRSAFENLPEILLAAMRWPCCGVMIARGDLAVECGFERLAEVQEEILWICEAAHVPVVWATQVLENLAKKGMPSRAEITDAAMGHRAECVMLNKGPHIVEAVRALDDILRRMQEHQTKKRSMLRELRLAHSLPPTGA